MTKEEERKISTCERWVVFDVFGTVFEYLRHKLWQDPNFAQLEFSSLGDR